MKFGIALGQALPIGLWEGSLTACGILSPIAGYAGLASRSGSRIGRKVVHIARKSKDLLAFRGEGPVRPFRRNRDEAREHKLHGKGLPPGPDNRACARRPRPDKPPRTV